MGEFGAGGADAMGQDVTWEVMSRQIRDLILLADATGRVFYASPACSALGYRQADIVGHTAAEFIHPDELAEFNGNIAAVLAGGEPPCREHWFRRHDGSWVSLEGNPSVLRGSDGAVVGFVTVLRDTTARAWGAARQTPAGIAGDAA
jgi:PAS domain S-box-containing protein